MGTLTAMAAIQLFIYCASWLIFPLTYYFARKKWLILLAFSLFFIYARFIEPNLLHVNNYKIETGFKAKYALIADIHLGVFKRENYLKRVMEEINEQDIDAILVAGDFTNEAQYYDLSVLFKPFSKAKVPIYAVLGNHDCESPGPRIRDELEKVLTSLGVTVIGNKTVVQNGVTIVGLGSHLAGDDRIEILGNFGKDENIVVLAHNPDTTLSYGEKHYPDITFSGHTHGGQVRIPFLYEKIIPVKGDVPWNQGLYERETGKVFVTSGIGEIGLPMRFLIPPAIDIIELY